MVYGCINLPFKTGSVLWDGPLVWEQNLKKLYLSSLGLQRVNSPPISSQYCALQTYSGISVNDTVKTI